MKAEKAQLFSKSGFEMYLQDVEEFLNDLQAKAKQQEDNRVMNHNQA